MCLFFERPGDQEGEIRPTTLQVVATPGQEAADIYGRVDNGLEGKRTGAFLGSRPSIGFGLLSQSQFAAARLPQHLFLTE